MDNYYDYDEKVVNEFKNIKVGDIVVGEEDIGHTMAEFTLIVDSVEWDYGTPSDNIEELAIFGHGITQDEEDFIESCGLPRRIDIGNFCYIKKVS